MKNQSYFSLNEHYDKQDDYQLCTHWRRRYTAAESAVPVTPKQIANEAMAAYEKPVRASRTFTFRTPGPVVPSAPSCHLGSRHEIHDRNFVDLIKSDDRAGAFVQPDEDQTAGN